MMNSWSESVCPVIPWFPHLFVYAALPSMSRVDSAARAKLSAIRASSRLRRAWWTFSSCSLRRKRMRTGWRSLTSLYLRLLPPPSGLSIHLVTSTHDPPRCSLKGLAAWKSVFCALLRWRSLMYGIDMLSRQEAGKPIPECILNQKQSKTAVSKHLRWFMSN